MMDISFKDIIKKYIKTQTEYHKILNEFGYNIKKQNSN